MANSIWNHRRLIGQMAWRDVIGRYKGSVLGLLWSLINPFLMLTVYTFVFSVVFKARWETYGDESKVSFALLIFVGLIMHSALTEALNRAPYLVLSNPNYVKKIVFPLEILPIVCLIAALFHAMVSLTVLVIALVIYKGFLPWTTVLLPLVIAPLAVLISGLAWMLASLGVYLRDVGQTISVVTTVLLFMSTAFYPLAALPEQFHPFILANPLTFIIEQARSVAIYGRQPDWSGLGIYMILAFGVAWSGYAWFQKTRKGFADVI